MYVYDNNVIVSFTKKEAAVAAAFLVPILLETGLIIVAIGLVIWKRITVAKFLYNLQLPKLREIPRLVIRKFRPSSSTPPPELAIAIHVLYLLRIYHNY